MFMFLLRDKVRMSPSLDDVAHFRVGVKRTRRPDAILEGFKKFQAHKWHEVLASVTASHTQPAQFDPRIIPVDPHHKLVLGVLDSALPLQLHIIKFRVNELLVGVGAHMHTPSLMNVVEHLLRDSSSEV